MSLRLTPPTRDWTGADLDNTAQELQAQNKHLRLDCKTLRQAVVNISGAAQSFVHEADTLLNGLPETEATSSTAKFVKDWKSFFEKALRQGPNVDAQSRTEEAVASQ